MNINKKYDIKNKKIGTIVQVKFKNENIKRK